MLHIVRSDYVTRLYCGIIFVVNAIVTSNENGHTTMSLDRIEHITPCVELVVCIVDFPRTQKIGANI